MTDAPMKLARTLRLDESDENVFETPAEPFEWAISGAFEFSDWTEADLTGKRRQAFANGWLGLESFGRATLVAVTAISEAEYAALVDRLCAHFVERYGAPDVEVQEVSCLGRCDTPPAALVNGVPLGGASPERVADCARDPDRLPGDEPTARGPALEELAHMRAMCEDQPDNAILTVERTLVEMGVKEAFRALVPQEATLDQFAVHGS